ncbi:MAG: (R)-6-hydroxynicotine oxidase, partial [Solirubrobacterales bacterium]|nr:(R)-6-hydroxynicotine oxidase [Solirubrobacterales bacterium]
MHTTTVASTLITPADARYDELRTGFNLAVDVRPAAIVVPETVEDVITAVRYARDHGLRLAPQSTGHNLGAHATLANTVLLKMSNLRGVEVDVAARRARVLGGTRWKDVTPHLEGTGLSALHGSSPEVGVAGYSLGGGMGWQARKHGLQANSVTAVELVTAEGELVRADAGHNADLFWAVRGGGGNFGVVTALEFELYPISDLYAGWLIFPWERSAEVLHTWNALLPSMPEEMTSVGRILRLPPIPEIPEPLRGAEICVVEGAFLGTQADGEALLAPLRALGPVADTFAMVGPEALGGLHQDPDAPAPAVSVTQLLDELPAEAIDRLVAVVGPGSDSPFLSVELRHTGGALGRPAPGGGALPQLNGSFAMFAIGIPFDAAAGEALEAAGARLTAALAEYDRGR